MRTYSNNNQTWISAWSHRSQAVGKRGQGDCLTFICGSVERSLKQHRPFDSQCIQVDDQHLHRVTDLHILFCGDSNCCAELPCRMRPNVRVCVDPLPVRAATSGTTWACASYTASSVRRSWHRPWPVVATWHVEAFATGATGHTPACTHTMRNYNPGPVHTCASASACQGSISRRKACIHLRHRCIPHVLQVASRRHNRATKPLDWPP